MSLDQPIGLFIFDYAWILFILVTCINGLLMKARFTKIVERNPELQEGYDRLVKGYLICFNIPWVIMGLGMLLGGVPGTFSYFRPRAGNPFVISWYIAVVILWLLAIWWIYFRGGAEFLVKYKGVFNQDIRSPALVKIYIGLMLLGGVFGMYFMWRL